MRQIQEGEEQTAADECQLSHGYLTCVEGAHDFQWSLFSVPEICWWRIMNDTEVQRSMRDENG